MDRDVGFQFEIIYRDAHLLEIRISAWNRAFGGVADVYIGLDHLKEIEAILRGFPKNSLDVREVTFGAFGPKSVPGRRVSMRFYCADKSGHTNVDSTIESDYNEVNKVESVTLSLHIEAAAVDEFVKDVHRIGVEKTGTAYLKGAVDR
ncbi:MAG TPA: hypothetical protein VFK06_17005 [Candidatus Angelobacter sp.]|nr:hypothetical protein [Candidatus Angelobacter sp.]